MICPDCNQPFAIGSWPFRCHGDGHSLGPFWGGESSIHPSERVVVLRNPETGEVRIPGRADKLSRCDLKYLSLGYQRQEISTVPELRKFEKTHGKVHERSHFDPGSGRAERETGSR